MDTPFTLTANAFRESTADEVYASLGVLDKLYNYNHWIFNKVRPFIRPTVCEVGCGTGNITQFLLNKERVIGMDPHAVSLQQARSRFRDHMNLSFVQGTIDQYPNDDIPSESVESVICLNVLEHIEDDVDALRRMRELCKVKGRVIILVPALMSAYGEIDRSFGHYRRYSKRTLGRAFEAAGLDVVYHRYMNAVGYFGWLWEGRVMRRKRIRPQAASTFNRMVPFVDAFERVVRPPFGQSIIMVGVRRPSA